MVAKDLGLVHISTGDIFREYIKEGGELGTELAKYVNNGMLVPDELTIKMVKNPDIVAGVAALKDHRPYVVGFAAETNNVEEYARQKRIRKNLDLICANDVSQPTQGFNSDNNALHLFWQDGDKVLPLERKELLGQLLLDEIVTRYDEKNRR